VQIDDDLPHISHNPFQLLEEDQELEDHEQQERRCRGTGRGPGMKRAAGERGEESVKIITID
jgi:hypothetical protein